MANFFSANYWKALYFRAMGGQETAVDPNAMSGSFAGSSSWTGTLALPEGAISGAFAGASTFTGTLTGGAQYPSQDFRNVLDGHSEDYWLRKRARERAEQQRIYDERIAALELELREAEASLAVIETEPAASKAVMSHDATAEAARLAEMARQEEDELLILLLAA